VSKKKKLSPEVRELNRRAKKPKLVAPGGPTLKLDLAAGQTPREGFEGVDLFEGAKHVVDLQRFPWPWADSSVAEVHCSHYVEHIPAIYVGANGDALDERGQPFTSATGKDALFAFFDELYRILVPGGTATIIVPCGRSNRGFQDPTHRRFFMAETFIYLNREWRQQQKLDHYEVGCHFMGDVSPIIPTEYAAWSSDVQARRFTHEWNTIVDWQAVLRAIK